jgi:2-C-methyl-D-erythritol 4-phosphate cytidylyltransferase
MAVAVVLAAGRGERLGDATPKALLPLCGREMLDWSVDAIASLDVIERIVVVLPAGHLHRAPTGTIAVLGGEVRSESVRLGLEAAGDGELVLVHDAARPLATPQLFVRVLAELRDSDADAVVAALPVTDTIKQVADDRRSVVGTLDRAHLWAAQTPQGFRMATLRRVLAQADRATLAAATDDAYLIERAGGTVRVVSGEPTNLKVTTRVDLRVAELLAEQRLAAWRAGGTGEDPR